jgi:hypothetical protein
MKDIKILAFWRQKPIRTTTGATLFDLRIRIENSPEVSADTGSALPFHSNARPGGLFASEPSAKMPTLQNVGSKDGSLASGLVSSQFESKLDATKDSRKRDALASRIEERMAALR